MDEKRKKLVELIETLSLPVTRQEAMATVKDLTDEEVEKLLSIYTHVDEYENDLEDFVRETNPQAYNELIEKHQENLKKNETEYLSKLDTIRESEDINLDAEEAKEEREIEEIATTEENTAKVFESMSEDIDKVLKTSTAN